MVSAPAFALLYGLDAALAVIISVTGTLVVPLTLPPLALGLLGLDVNVPMDVLMGRLGLLVVLPFLAAGVIRRFVSQTWIKAQARRLDGVTVLVLLLFVLGMMAGVGDLMRERPGYIAAVTAAAFAANLGLHAVGTLVWWLLGRKPALTVGFCTGNRNMGLVLVSLADRAPPEVLIFFALSQFPMYMLPALLVATYRRIDPPEAPPNAEVQRKA
jgi:BASS family bile acid:Na+ symporter